ncbi:TetR/AcrR family transcriptional regulator [Acidobacteriota bacterium]
MSKNPKEKILSAALKEFAAHGYGGARMDTISKEAGVNKAMLFYYFVSKENLYQTVIDSALKEYLKGVRSMMRPDLSPQKLLEELPKLIFTFFSKKRDIIRLIGFELIQNPDNLVPYMSRVLQGGVINGPKLVSRRVTSWYKKGKITEPDPLHFILNIMSLSIFSIVVRPMVAGIFGRSDEDDDKFYEKRIQSVTNVLIHGMLAPIGEK